jgi:hypothetical protein
VTYVCTLDVSRELVLYVARLLAAERRRRGTRRGTRLLTPFHQARFALAWFRDRCDVERLGAGFGLSRATAYRYLDEALCVLSDQAPNLQEALDRAREEELAYLILDGTIIACDRLAGTTISRKGKEIDLWYSCAVWRPAVSPAQPGGTRKEVPGSPDLPGGESRRGQEHVRKAVAAWRRPGRGAARSARYGQGWIA